MEGQVTRSIQAAVVALAALLVVGLSWFLVNRYRAEQRALAAVSGEELLAASGLAATPAAGAQPAPEAAPAPEPAPVKVWVHVAGAVQRPGVYELEEGARLADAIAAAGGPLSDARPDVLNLAAKVVDGGKVYVFSEAEVKQQGETPVAAAGATFAPIQSAGEVAAAANPAAGGKVNLNSASQKELESVVGIGPSTARAIIDYRTSKGPFKRVEDLDNVKGIGPATLEKLRPYVTV